jgi:hypothetical protein
VHEINIFIENKKNLNDFMLGNYQKKPIVNATHSKIIQAEKKKEKNKSMALKITLTPRLTQT